MNMRVARQLLLIGCMLSGASLLAQEEGLDRLGRPNWIFHPKSQVDNNADNVSHSVRDERGKLFNSPVELNAKRLDDPATSSDYGTSGSHCFMQSDPLPVDSADAIVVGEATSLQPFLSEDHTRIYSELQFAPKEVIKDTSETLTPESSFILLQEGGTIHLPSGKDITAVPFSGANPIRLKTHYLLFLKHIASAQAYTVDKIWDISGNQPVDLDRNGHPRIGPVTSLANETTTEESLVALVKNKAQQK